MRERRGRGVATILSGAWRAAPPVVDFRPEEVREATPLLLGGGSAALAWWRIRESPLSGDAAARPLRQAYRVQALHAAVQARRITWALGALREARIEPLLLKGAAASRLYPDPALRPHGDIDLLLPPEQHLAAHSALGTDPGSRYPVDLHGAVPGLERSWHDLFERSVHLRVGESRARAPGPEDHFRILCLHAMRETVWRPLWLCDIAAALEALPEPFDWEGCLGGTRRSAEWVTFASLLAHHLLGARLDAAPPAWKARAWPRWLAPAVLRQWGSSEYYMRTTPVALSLGSPAAALRGVALRWPSPLRATVERGAPFNAFPRWPYQLAECVSRAFHFARRLASGAI